MHGSSFLYCHECPFVFQSYEEKGLHIGAHEDALKKLTTEDDSIDYLRKCLETVAKGLKAAIHASKSLVVLAVCKHGKHRAVATGEMVRAGKIIDP